MSPAGNPVAVQLNGPTPPVMVIVVEYGMFSHATWKGVGVMVRGSMGGGCSDSEVDIIGRKKPIKSARRRIPLVGNDPKVNGSANAPCGRATCKYPGSWI